MIKSLKGKTCLDMTSLGLKKKSPQEPEVVSVFFLKKATDTN